MTNKTHTFDEWFAQLKMLAKKVGWTLDANMLRYRLYYEDGFKPDQAMEKDMIYD